MFIVVVALVLRLIPPGTTSLSNDELSSLARVQYNSVTEVIDKGVYIDYHPAGLQLFIYYWTKIFGMESFLLRLPFVLFFCGAVWLTYLLGRKWFNETAGLFAAALLAFSSLVHFYTHLARMYSPGMFFCLLAVYGWTKFITGKSVKGWWVWVISSMICMHIHYFTVLFSGMLAAGVLLFPDRINLKYIGSCILIALSFVPEIPVFLAQLETGDIGGWLSMPRKTFLVEFFYELFNKSIPLLVAVIIILCAGIFSKNAGGKNYKWRLLGISWFVLSFLTGYLYSVLRSPVLQHSTLFFTLPFFLLACFSFIPDTFMSGSRRIFASIIFLVAGTGSLYASGYYTKPHFGVFREIAEDLAGWRLQYGNVPSVVNVINPFYFFYYSKDTTGIIWKIDNNDKLALLKDSVSASTSDHFAFVWSNSSHPHEIIELIREKYPNLSHKKVYFNSASYLFSKTLKDNFRIAVFDSTINADKDCRSFEVLSSGSQYSKGISKSGGQFTSPSYAFTTISFLFQSKKSTNSTAVISFERGDKILHYHSRRLDSFQKKDGWSQGVFSAEIPEEFTNGDRINTYIYSPDGDTVKICNYRMIISEADYPYEGFER